MKLDRIINSIFTSNTYILQDEYSQNAYLVDVGDIEPILALGLDIKGVFLTHGHFDHIYGISSLVSHYPSCVIYTSKAGREFLANEKLNLSWYHGTPVSFSSSQIQEVSEGTMISLFDGLQMQVFETPGHNPSCVTFRIENYLFTGDAFIPNTKLLTNLPNAVKQLAITNRQKIINELINELTTICAGHGDIVYPNEFQSLSKNLLLKNKTTKE